MKEVTKAIFRNLKAMFAAMLRSFKTVTSDPVRELQLVKDEANQKIVQLQLKATEVIESREAAKDMMKDQEKLAVEFKERATQAKHNGEPEVAKKYLSIFLRHNENVSAFKRSIEGFETLRMQLKEQHDNLELEVMSIEANISSVSAMSDLAKLDVSINDPHSGINMNSIREAINNAESAVRGIERKASAQRESNQMFNKQPLTVAETHGSQINELYETL